MSPRFAVCLEEQVVDELPQLINVLKGEMSFIGSRPFPENDLTIMQRFEPEFYFRRRNINSKPGITGYCQVYGYKNTGYAEFT